MPVYVILDLFQINHKIINKVQRKKNVSTKRGVFSDFPYI